MDLKSLEFRRIKRDYSELQARTDRNRFVDCMHFRSPTACVVEQTKNSDYAQMPWWQHLALWVLAHRCKQHDLLGDRSERPDQISRLPVSRFDFADSEFLIGFARQLFVSLLGRVGVRVPHH